MKNAVLIGKTTLNPTDIIILVLAGLMTIGLYQQFWFTDHGTGEAHILVVQIAQDAIREYPLQKDQIIEIEGPVGRSLIEIKQGKARFLHSACRNQFCVLHGWITTAGETVACLPNRISITLKGRSSEYDALAGGQ